LDRRFIEESFPVKEVSIESAKEKSIRQGHISTLHIWWARRPLASSRATNYAALIPAPKNMEEWNKERNFIIELCKWDNSLNKNLIEKARKDILEANGGQSPRVLDPFSGGGSIPLEALRLGCETYAIDYNPVAVLIEKCTIEYPQKYGLKLVNEIIKLENWILEQVKREIGKFYPEETNEKNGYFAKTVQQSTPIGYVWARTIQCQNPSCGAEIPLLKHFWLVKKLKKQILLYPYIQENQVEFKVVGTDYEKIPNNFNPNEGTISKAIAKCLVCGSIIDAKDVRKQFQQGKSDQRMIAVIFLDKGQTNKKYRIVTEIDLEAYKNAENYLQIKKEKLEKEWGMNPVPDEPIHTPDNKEYEPGNLLYNFTPVVLYGMTKWGDLFNSRSKLALISFIDELKQVFKKMLEDNYEDEYAKVIITYLALGIDWMSNKYSNLTFYDTVHETITQTFNRGALQMSWDYTEINPFNPSTGGLASYFKFLNKLIKTSFTNTSSPAKINQGTATNLPYKDNYFDAVFTDPPYYDNIPYADLSDFFYVWLKRSIGDIYPDLFTTPLTPKSNEIIAELPLLRGMKKTQASLTLKDIKTHKQFENMLLQSFKEIHRVLKPNGIATIVYAHKTTKGWETVINALLDSGLTVTASWPIATEMKTRLRAKKSATLTSSIYIIARKIERKETGFYSEIKKKLQSYLNEKLERIWQEGISGADFFIAAIGAGIEVFGEYKKVLDYEGNIIKADKFLEEIRKISTDFAVNRILYEEFAAKITPMTMFYVLWRWNYQEAKVLFDEARKLAQGIGINLELEWNKGFIKKDKEFIRVIGPKDRKMSELEDSTELIDILHKILLLWEIGAKENFIETLKSSGYGNDEIFYRVAQAISETLPNESKEKKLIDGFLSGKEKIREQIRITRPVKRLEEWMK